MTTGIQDEPPRPGRTQPNIDPVTTEWLAWLRDPASTQTVFDPDGWGKGWRRTPHRDYREMKHRYGRRFIERVEKMNDSGRYKLPDIADYVEKEQSL